MGTIDLLCDLASYQVFFSGFVSLTSLKLYRGDPTYWQSILDIIKLHSTVTDSGFAKLIDMSDLYSDAEYSLFGKHLTNYWDKQLTELLQYGFPFDF